MQSPCAVILEAPKIKYDTLFIYFSLRGLGTFEQGKVLFSVYKLTISHFICNIVVWNWAEPYYKSFIKMHSLTKMRTTGKVISRTKIQFLRNTYILSIKNVNRRL